MFPLSRLNTRHGVTYLEVHAMVYAMAQFGPIIFLAELTFKSAFLG